MTLSALHLPNRDFVRPEHQRERIRGPRAYALDYMPGRGPNSLYMIYEAENTAIRQVRADCFFVLAPQGFYKLIYGTDERIPEIWIEVADDNCRFRMTLWDKKERMIIPLSKALYDPKEGLMLDNNEKFPLIDRASVMNKERKQFEKDKNEQALAGRDLLIEEMKDRVSGALVAREGVVVNGFKPSSSLKDSANVP